MSFEIWEVMVNELQEFNKRTGEIREAQNGKTDKRGTIWKRRAS